MNRFVQAASFVFLLCGLIAHPAHAAATPACFGLASAFVQKSSERGGLPFPEALQEKKLDYSMTSLKVVDAYLDVLNQNQSTIPATQYINAVMRGGCYVGEVLRKNAKREYDWMPYETYVAAHPSARLLLPKQTVENSFLLVSGQKESSSFTLPLSRVSRYIFEGQANSTQAYVAGEVERKN